MDLRGARLAYFPNSDSYTAPSDRRRFVYYARSRGLKFERADPRERYDVVVLNQRADLSAWTRYPPSRGRLIYEANDSYLSVPMSDLKQMFRGTFKFLSGQSRRLQLNYRAAVQAMCERSDAVICSTDEQETLIRPHCANVHQILDFQDDDVMAIKQRYDSRGTFHFVWEGLASSGIPTELLRDILEPIGKRHDIALHLVTDLFYHRYSNVVGKVHTTEQIRKAFGRFAPRVFLYQWNPFALSVVAAAADMAVIPIDLDDPFACGKPENKLLLWWRMGVPTIASATPAYDRAMRRAGLNMTCHTVAEWREMIERYMTDESERERAGQSGRHVTSTFYSSGEMLNRWDAAVRSVFSPAAAT